MSMRLQAEQDLAITLEGEWGLPVVLISPDNVTYTLSGQVMYDTVTKSPTTGEQIVDKRPVVVLRRSSLARIPRQVERWIVRIPTTPDPDAPLVDFALDTTKAPDGGGSLGIVRLWLKKIKQGAEVPPPPPAP